MQKDIFYARMRKYASALEAELHPDNVPVSVYDNLIQAVKGVLPVLHRYLRLRKRLLNLDQLRMYDLYVPLVPDVDFRIPFEEAKRMVKAGLVPLGGEYQAALDECFNGRWIDVYENQGKMSGAYVRTVYSATRMCSSTTRARSSMSSPSRTNSGTRCTATSPLLASPLSTPTTRSSSPRWRRPSMRRSSSTTCSTRRPTASPALHPQLLPRAVSYDDVPPDDVRRV